MFKPGIEPASLDRGYMTCQLGLVIRVRNYSSIINFIMR